MICELCAKDVGTTHLCCYERELSVCSKCYGDHHPMVAQQQRRATESGWFGWMKKTVP